MRPNVLFIHSDQHRYDCIAGHGHKLLKTPALDGLINGGADFSHAFTPSPICTPARACLLTGRWPTQHRSLCIPNSEIYQPVAESETLVWQLLRDAGYQQALVGKWHGETPRHPTEYIERYVPENDYFAWRRGQGVPDQPDSNGWFGESDPHISTEQHRLAWEAREVAACMKEFHDAGKPWMIRWDPSEPHLPCRVPESIAGMYPPEQVPPWASFADKLVDKPFIQSQQRRTWGVEGWTWERWAPVVSRYLAEITLMDQQIGRLLAQIESLGQTRNTLIVYGTDHGDFCGDRGQMDKHFAMYEELVHVPLILRWPGVVPAGVRPDGFVSSEIDLAATFASVATGHIPGRFEGVDLLPVARGEKSIDRTDIFTQYQGTQFGLYSQRMLRDRRWKYVWNPTDVDELYDLESDPQELHNQAREPGCSGELTRLRGRLIAWMESINDPLLNCFTRVQLTTYGVKP